jgi:hypothetical protein
MTMTPTTKPRASLFLQPAEILRGVTFMMAEVPRFFPRTSPLAPPSVAPRALTGRLHLDDGEGDGAGTRHHRRQYRGRADADDDDVCPAPLAVASYAGWHDDDDDL